MIIGESIEVVDRFDSPFEAVTAVNDALSSDFDKLLEVTNHEPEIVDGKQRITARVPVVYELSNQASFDEAWEQYEQEGGIDELALHRNVDTGAIAYGAIKGKFPSSLSEEEGRLMFQADTWNVRVHFPSNDDPTIRRLVIDSWQDPLTHLTLASNALVASRTPERQAAYDDLYRNVFVRKDGAGVPIGAVDIDHTVIGRSYSLTEKQVGAANQIAQLFSTGMESVTDRPWDTEPIIR